MTFIAKDPWGDVSGYNILSGKFISRDLEIPDAIVELCSAAPIQIPIERIERSLDLSIITIHLKDNPYIKHPISLWKNIHGSVAAITNDKDTYQCFNPSLYREKIPNV